MGKWQGGSYSLPNGGVYVDVTSHIPQLIMGFKVSVKKRKSNQPGDCQTGEKHYTYGLSWSGELYLSQKNPDFRNLLVDGYYAISSATFGGKENIKDEDLTAVVTTLTLSKIPDSPYTIVLLDQNSNIRLKYVTPGPPNAGEFTLAAAVCTLNAAESGHRFKCTYSAAEVAGVTSAIQVTGTENPAVQNGVILYNERLIETGAMITNRLDLYGTDFGDFDFLNMPADGVPPTETLTFDCVKTSDGILKYYMPHTV